MHDICLCFKVVACGYKIVKCCVFLARSGSGERNLTRKVNETEEVPHRWYKGTNASAFSSAYNTGSLVFSAAVETD